MNTINLPYDITTIPLLRLKTQLGRVYDIELKINASSLNYYRAIKFYQLLQTAFLETKKLAFAYQKERVNYIENNYPTTSSKVFSDYHKHFQKEFNAKYISLLTNIQSMIVDLLKRLDNDELELILIELHDENKYHYSINELLSNPITEYWKNYYDLLIKRNLIMTINSKKELKYSIDFLIDYQFQILINSFCEAGSNYHKFSDDNVKLAFAVFNHLNAFVEIAEGFHKVLHNLESDYRHNILTKEFKKIQLLYRQTKDIKDDEYKRLKEKFYIDKDNRLIKNMIKEYPNIIKWDSQKQLYFLSNQSLLDIVVLFTNVLYQAYIMTFTKLLRGDDNGLITFLQLIKEYVLKQEDIKTGKERYSFERIFYSKVLTYLYPVTKKDLVAMQDDLTDKLKQLSNDR